jgi:hypothetical protein
MMDHLAVVLRVNIESNQTLTFSKKIIIKNTSDNLYFLSAIPKNLDRKINPNNFKNNQNYKTKIKKKIQKK